jgi:hypothetical protein
MTPLPSSTFLSINQCDMNNASQVIEHISKHEDDPLDAVFIFNLSLLSNLNNIIKIMERLNRKSPRLFLIFIGQETEINADLLKLLEGSLEWTIIICNGIDSSKPNKYRVETESNRMNKQPISATDLFDFINNELNTKKYLNQIIFLF